jgi:hypothetical protein
MMRDVFVESFKFMSLAFAMACSGGVRAPAQSSLAEPVSTDTDRAQKQCGDPGQVHTHDLGSAEATEAFAPCAKAGPRDYSAVVRMMSIDQGVHIVIDATDDEVTLLGPDVKDRDIVMVYPKGKGGPAVEVGLVKTKTGYRGDKIVFWEDLGSLTDEGAHVDVAIFDHDRSSHSTEEMHVTLSVSTGKSCERALDENVQRVDLRAKQGAAPDLTKEQLGAPMRTSSFFAGCGLPDSSNADICVAVKYGKPVGVSVKVMPANNRLAACIDRSARRLSFPASQQLDVIHQKF